MTAQPLTPAVPGARRRPASAATSTYTELAATIRQSGLMRRRYAYYWTRMVGAVLGFGALVAAMVLVGNSWWQLLLAALLGLLVTQFGFLGHDAAHRQIFVSAAWNDWTARILSGVFAGLSYGWWRGKHNRHHATPNQEGLDPDIAPGVLAFTRDIAAGRTAGARGWFLRRQGWLFFPLLTLEGLNLHWAGLERLFRDREVRHRRTEATLVLLRLGLYVTGLLLLLPPGKAVAFLAVQMAVFGVCLGGSFAPNHKGMPIVPRTMKLDFLQRQVLTSRNVRGGPVVDAFMGGLNYQVEHHLFPSMPRPNLKRARPLVRAHCFAQGVPYQEVGLWTSYAIVVDYLNNVGLRARDPFDCPLAGQLRG
ncbi:fatty acid desaturase family protein [Nocardioides euryhalodurans]|uniref:Acyl-CoA desaturase n=1 Tax=Nocardioides euryhalodurans TaxID=2518370 RepID=A0A4P7GIR2_9ACTN|nr:acyl-CoA desaturase [Nocardioides euryhalodurans]QBR91743.1 acyl-CoA desaturase [Nocardioides euryhalodurans]